MLSHKARYAIAACLDLARRGEERAALAEELSDGGRLPRKFLEAVLLELKNAGLLRSKKGRGGGYQLARPADRITLLDVVAAIEGPLGMTPCALATGPAPCPECPDPQCCAVGEVMGAARQAMEAVLGELTLADLHSRELTLRQQRDGVPMFHI